MALMDIAVIPLDAKEKGFSPYVAELQKLLAASGLDYRLHDMGTTVEGEAKELFTIAEKLHEHCFHDGILRVYTVIKIDDRRDRKVAIGDKVASVKGRIALQD
jgi:uncharacterized protein (TIGR00106 family)